MSCIVTGTLRKFMSVSHSEAAEPAGVLNLDWDALRWRELEWSALPHTTKKGTIPYLTVREVGRLENAMTNDEAKPHLVKSYNSMESPAFNGYVYVGTIDKDYKVEHVALRWVMKRSINLSGFKIEVDDSYSTWRGGLVLIELMSHDSDWYDMKLAEYYAARGKLTNLDAINTDHSEHKALTKASYEGHLDILKALIAAGANKDKTDSYGVTPLIYASIYDHVEIVKALLTGGRLASTKPITMLGPH